MTPFLSEDILRRACRAANTNKSELLSKRGSKALRFARQAAALAMREHDLPLNRIAVRMRRDRATVRYNIRRANALIASDPEFAAIYSQVQI